MRSVQDVVAEGQAKTLEQIALVRKQLDGSITSEESTRLAMLNGNLLGLVDEATALGFDPLTEWEETPEEPWYDFHDDDEDIAEEAYPKGYPEF